MFMRGDEPCITNRWLFVNYVYMEVWFDTFSYNGVGSYGDEQS